MCNLILASSSPRREELLRNAGFVFSIEPSSCSEKISADSPEELVTSLSKIKAFEVAKNHSNDECIVIGADTVVVFNGEIMGKPKDGSDAVRMLKALSGQTHDVFTAVSLVNSLTLKCETFFEKTEVTFYKLSDEEIRSYALGGEPKDKAGAYAIQGGAAKFVKKINGDFYNVMGLPIGRLNQELKKHEALLS